MRISPDDVRRSLAGLPAEDSPWISMLQTNARPAAVAIPIRFTPDPVVIAILRSAELREHASQVAFPGGKREPSDVDLYATALREMDEEVALAGEGITHLGELTPTPTYNGRYLIHPYVVAVGEGLAPVACSGEIAHLLELPLGAYLRGEAPRYGVMLTWQGAEILMPHFRLDACVLYGASAVIFHELVERIAAGIGATLPPPILEREMPWGNREPV
ncbi:MAG TPA: CoA pyrophosphatase [Polyangium sp.]|nr:CoA pyrophosphatase [Polyangium sp.]